MSARSCVPLSDKITSKHPWQNIIVRDTGGDGEGGGAM